MYTGGLLGLIYAAGPVAKAVVIILFIFSIISWTIMFFNWKQYKKVEKELIEAGFDVLVFIPSIDEDISRITCGNAILSNWK